MSGLLMVGMNAYNVTLFFLVSIKASQKKSKYTNLVENLNSQMRDKISYLVRKTKAHAKSFEWLDNRLAMFFVNLNLIGK